MPSRSSRAVVRSNADNGDSDTRMRQLIMELTRAQSAAALPAPAMPTLTKAGGTHDRQSFLRAAQRAVTRSAKPAGQYMPAPLIAAIATDPTFERRAQASARAATAECAPAARWVWWRGRSGSHGPPQGPEGRTVTPQKQWRCSSAWRRTSALRRHSQWRTKVHANPWQSLFLIQWSSQGTLVYPKVSNPWTTDKVSNPWTTVTTTRTRMEKVAACCGSAGPRATACGSARHPQWEGEI